MRKGFKILTIISGILAVLFGLFTQSGVHWTSLLYFTQQSNIWAVIMSLVLLIKKDRPPLLNNIRFMTVSAISLTLIVFNLLLTPQLIASGDYGYLFSPGNVFAHYLTPILHLTDYLIYGKQSNKRVIFASVILPLIYFVFAMTANPLFNIMFYQKTVPYFFLDYQEYSFFKIGYAKTIDYGLKLGVFYWIIIILMIILILGSVLYGVKAKLSNKRASTTTNPHYL